MLPPPHLRAILLGASNLHYGLASLAAALAGAAGGPIEGWVAAGRGRSYGGASRFAFVRRLPGVLESPLWAEVARRPPLPCVALVTDVGNDLVYGAPMASILGWVETCLDRLAALDARAVLTLPPLARLERLSAAQFQLFKALFFPGRRGSWEGMRQRARALDAGLREMAAARGLPALAPPLAWYGLDPIHLRRSARPTAWQTLLRLWELPTLQSHPALPWRGSRISAETRLFGRPFPWTQPALRFADGSTLHLH
jgi:hypothetical protein